MLRKIALWGRIIGWIALDRMQGARAERHERDEAERIDAQPAYAEAGRADGAEQAPQTDAGTDPVGRWVAGIVEQRHDEDVGYGEHAAEHTHGSAVCRSYEVDQAPDLTDAEMGGLPVACGLFPCRRIRNSPHLLGHRPAVPRT